jgi:hypothetical protein
MKTKMMQATFCMILAIIAITTYGADLGNFNGLDLSVPAEQSKAPFFVDLANSTDAERQYVNGVIQQIRKSALTRWPTDETGARLYGSGDVMITMRRDGSIEDVQTMPSSTLLSQPITAAIKKSAPYSRIPQELFSGHDAITFKAPFDYPNKGEGRYKAPFKLRGNNQRMGIDTSVPF